MQLSNATLIQLPATVGKVNTHRAHIKTRMVHIGFGAFHRAHQAVYAEALAVQQQSDWGYCVVNLIGGLQQIEALKQQDLLYSVCEMAGEAWHSQIIGIMTQALHRDSDGIDAVLTAMAQPDVAIVSMTVTEKGYCYLPTTASIDLANPLIIHDLHHPNTPKSLPGVIVAALRLRKQHGLAGFTVLSCDNIPENGHITKKVVLALATLQDPVLAQWIEANVSFPSTMVDRIVPAMTPETTAKTVVQLGGIEDFAGVVCEPFRQWVIEDNFVAGRPEWEKVGAELVIDVLPYEEMKLRMLNGSHSFLAYLGYLAGYQTIDVCMQDANFVKATRRLMLQEQVPTLRVTNVDLVAYADALLARYHNTGLKHKTGQIAMDGSLKLPQRMLDSIRQHLAVHTDFSCLALGVAAWMRYVSGVDDAGQPIIVVDPLSMQYAQLVLDSGEDDRVMRLLSLKSIFGTDLVANADFVVAVQKAYASLVVHGAKYTINQLVTHASQS